MSDQKKPTQINFVASDGDNFSAPKLPAAQKPVAQAAAPPKPETPKK